MQIYDLSDLLPTKENFNMISQMRRAALSVKLNFTEGCSRTSAIERKRYYEIARGSVIELDAVLETILDKKYLTLEMMEPAGKNLVECFKVLSKFMFLAQHSVKNK